MTCDSRPTQVAPVDSSTQSGHPGAARKRPSAPLLRGPGVRRTLIVVLVLNAIVALVKIVIGIRTGALTVLGAALESALDMFNNLIGVVLMDVAGRAPDEEHPYGHDKFETLGALGIVGFLSISCFELLREGVRHLVINEHPEFPSLAVWAASARRNVLPGSRPRRRSYATTKKFTPSVNPMTMRSVA